jgi:hypothetical protein
VIIKREKRQKDAPKRSKWREGEDIVDYVEGREEGGEDNDEKVVYRGGRGFLTDDRVARKAEMIALAQEAVKSPMPIHHWIMSWHEGEQPTPAQADRAVEVFLKQLGLEDHQALYGLHSDTDNVHLHIAVNMVHPETERVVFVRNDFVRVLEAAALLEHEQGWQSEPGAWFRVDEHGELKQVAGRPLGPRETAKPDARAERMETRTGEKSAQRIAIEEGAPAMGRATSWGELHANLAAVGMRFERKGSGAVLWVAEVAVKASQAGRKCSIGELEKRLGPFEPATPEVLATVKSREPVPVAAMATTAGWKEYQAERQEHYRSRTAAFSEHRERFGREWMEMLSRHRGARKEALAGNWTGRGAVLNEARSRVAAEQAAEKVELKERRERAGRLLRERFQRFPVYEAWLRRERTVELAEEWRYRDRGPGASVVGPAGDPAWDERKWMASYARDIRDFEAQRRGWDVEYRRNTQADPTGAVAFIDRGRKVDILEHRDRAAVLAALQLAAEKWYGKFEIQGDERYKRLCVELAVENRWTITNPELQPALEAERAYRQREFRPRSPLPGMITERRELPAAAAVAATVVSKERREGVPVMEVAPPHPENSAAEVYRRHLAEVWPRSGAIDVSRVDALIAVRLRVTGHDQAGIEKAVREAASDLRPDERRDWDAYAKRVARFAFGRPGSWDAKSLWLQREALLALEGRPTATAESAADPKPEGRGETPEAADGRTGRNGKERGGRGD